MSQLEHKVFKVSSLSVKQDEQTKETTIEGYAATFGNIDSYDDTIIKGAFEETTTGENGPRIAFCYQHDMRNPIGKIKILKEDGKGLFISVVISKSEENIAIKVREGILTEMSIGYWCEKTTYDEESGVRTLLKINLHEISLVTRAADAFATISKVKADDIELKQMDSDELKHLRTRIESEIKSRQDDKKTWLDYLK